MLANTVKITNKIQNYVTMPYFYFLDYKPSVKIIMNINQLELFCTYYSRRTQCILPFNYRLTNMEYFKLGNRGTFLKGHLKLQACLNNFGNTGCQVSNWTVRVPLMVLSFFSNRDYQYRLSKRLAYKVYNIVKISTTVSNVVILNLIQAVKLNNVIKKTTQHIL